MAVIYLTSGIRKPINPEAGAILWKILHGEIEPDEEQAKYAEGVEKLFLNWRNAPDSYIEANFDMIAKGIIAGWTISVDKDATLKKNIHDSSGRSVAVGNPVRPEPGDAVMLEFCEKWGLTKNGFPTNVAKKYY